MSGDRRWLAGAAALVLGALACVLTLWAAVADATSTTTTTTTSSTTTTV